MKIELYNFGVFAHSEFEFKNGAVILIFGDSGKGKSTIFDGIHWALYGSLRGVRPLENDRRKKSTHVKLIDKDCVIIRQSNPKILKVQTLNSEAKVGEVEPVEYLDEQAQEYLFHIYGKEKLWRANSYLAQAEHHIFLTGTQSDKLSILHGLSFSEENPRLDIDKISKRAKEYEKEYKLQKELYERRNQEWILEWQEKGLPSDPTIYDFCSQILREEEKKLETLTQSLSEYRLEIYEVRDRYTKLSTLKERQNNLRLEAKRVQKRVVNLAPTSQVEASYWVTPFVQNSIEKLEKLLSSSKLNILTKRSTLRCKLDQTQRKIIEIFRKISPVESNDLERQSSKDFETFVEVQLDKLIYLRDDFKNVWEKSTEEALKKQASEASEKALNLEPFRKDFYLEELKKIHNSKRHLLNLIKEENIPILINVQSKLSNFLLSNFNDGKLRELEDFLTKFESNKDELERIHAKLYEGELNNLCREYEKEEEEIEKERKICRTYKINYETLQSSNCLLEYIDKTKLLGRSLQKSSKLRQKLELLQEHIKKYLKSSKGSTFKEELDFYHTYDKHTEEFPLLSEEELKRCERDSALQDQRLRLLKLVLPDLTSSQIQELEISEIEKIYKDNRTDLEELTSLMEKIKLMKKRSSLRSMLNIDLNESSHFDIATSKLRLIDVQWVLEEKLKEKEETQKTLELFQRSLDVFSCPSCNCSLRMVGKECQKSEETYIQNVQEQISKTKKDLQEICKSLVDLSREQKILEEDLALGDIKPLSEREDKLLTYSLPELKESCDKLSYLLNPSNSFWSEATYKEPVSYYRACIQFSELLKQEKEIKEAIEAVHYIEKDLIKALPFLSLEQYMENRDLDISYLSTANKELQSIKFPTSTLSQLGLSMEKLESYALIYTTYIQLLKKVPKSFPSLKSKNQLYAAEVWQEFAPRQLQNILNDKHERILKSALSYEEIVKSPHSPFNIKVIEERSEQSSEERSEQSSEEDTNLKKNIPKFLEELLEIPIPKAEDLQALYILPKDHIAPNLLQSRKEFLNQLQTYLETVKTLNSINIEWEDFLEDLVDPLEKLESNLEILEDSEDKLRINGQLWSKFLKDIRLTTEQAQIFRKLKKELSEVLEAMEPLQNSSFEKAQEMEEEYRVQEEACKEQASKVNLTREALRLQNKRKELEKQKDALSVYHAKFQTCFELRELASHMECSLLADTVFRINEFAGQILDRLFEESITLSLSLYKKKEKDSNNVYKPQVNMSVQYQGRTYPDLKRMSGGERARVSLSLLLACNSIYPTTFLCMDELLSSLDSDHKAKAIQVIKDFMPGVTILNIDHECVSGHFDQVISFES